MQIQIRDVNQVGRELRVHFTSEWGSGEARWAGATPTPESAHDAELAIPKSLVWGATIRPTVEPGPLIEPTVQGNRLVAKLISAERDGTVVLRFGPSMILAEADGAPTAAPGSWVQVRAANLVLYPFRE